MKPASGKGGLYMEKKQLDINNMNGITEEEDKTCGLNHLGLTPMQMQSVFDIVETNLGKASAEPMRKILDNLTKRQ